MANDLWVSVARQRGGGAFPRGGGWLVLGTPAVGRRACGQPPRDKTLGRLATLACPAHPRRALPVARGRALDAPRAAFSPVRAARRGEHPRRRRQGQAQARRLRFVVVGRRRRRRRVRPIRAGAAEAHCVDGGKRPSDKAAARGASHAQHRRHGRASPWDIPISIQAPRPRQPAPPPPRAALRHRPVVQAAHTR